MVIYLLVRWLPDMESVTIKAFMSEKAAWAYFEKHYGRKHAKCEFTIEETELLAEEE